MDAIDAEQVALHRKAENLFIAEFVDHHRLQEAAVDDIQHVESLSGGMDALAGLELHMLEVVVIISDESARRDAEEIADIMHVGPDFMRATAGRCSP
jgi:hypothetical protein